MAGARTARKASTEGSAARAPVRAPQPATPAELLGTYIPDPGLWDQFGRIGGELTPQKVSSIIRNADGGSIAQFVDLAHESRQKDGHYQSIMQARELALARLDWGMNAPEDATPLEVEAAKACETAIRACPSFVTMTAHHVGEGLQFGFADSEAIWKVGGPTDDPTLRGLIIPDRYENISCRRYGFSTADGRLLFDAGGRGNVNTDGVDLLDVLPPGKIVRSLRRVNGDVPMREGLGRVLVWAALFRNWTLRDWLSLAEMAWKPIRVGKFNKDSVSSEDMTALQGVLERITTRGWAAIPNSVDLNVEFARGGERGAQGNHQALREHLGMEMSKAVLGGTLTSESGARGARSLGDVHERNARALRDADAASETAVVQRGVVEPFYDLNYGEGVRSAEFYYHTEDSFDLLQMAQAIKALVDAGDDQIPIAWAHDQGGIATVAGADADAVFKPTGKGATDDGNEDEPGTGNGSEDESGDEDA